MNSKPFNLKNYDDFCHNDHLDFITVHHNCHYILCINICKTSGILEAKKKMKPILKYQKLQYPEWPVENGSKSESVHTRQHVKMHNFTKKILFKAGYENDFGLDS